MSIALASFRFGGLDHNRWQSMFPLRWSHAQTMAGMDREDPQASLVVRCPEGAVRCRAPCRYQLHQGELLRRQYHHPAG